jgi:hypothetical protein
VLGPQDGPERGVTRQALEATINGGGRGAVDHEALTPLIRCLGGAAHLSETSTKYTGSVGWQRGGARSVGPRGDNQGVSSGLRGEGIGARAGQAPSLSCSLR